MHSQAACCAHGCPTHSRTQQTLKAKQNYFNLVTGLFFKSAPLPDSNEGCWFSDCLGFFFFFFLALGRIQRRCLSLTYINSQHLYVRAERTTTAQPGGGRPEPQSAAPPQPRAAPRPGANGAHLTFPPHRGAPEPSARPRPHTAPPHRDETLPLRRRRQRLGSALSSRPAGKRTTGGKGDAGGFAPSR